ncbi:MAG: DNA replication/repair protein RecF, partial [Deltaproteobacteria bacterium]|nr:DNA replication/repair protein RecF [Deltaproteobacteria bacterium]
MKILELVARDFRNLIDINVVFGEQLNVFHGANAQGKTNLLEAVYFLLTQRSFRGARGIEMVRFDAAQAQLRGRVDVAGLESDVVLLLDGEGRRVTVDGKALRSVSK